MSVSEVRHVVDRFVAVITGANSTNAFEELRDIFAEDVEYEDIPLRHVGRSAAEMLEFWKELRAHWPHRVEFSDFVYGENGYVFTTTLTGVMEHEYIGLPANGRHYEYSCVSVGEVRDGKIVKVRDIWNAADLLTQVGMTAIPATWASGEPLGLHTPQVPAQ